MGRRGSRIPTAPDRLRHRVSAPAHGGSARHRGTTKGLPPGELYAIYQLMSRRYETGRAHTPGNQGHPHARATRPLQHPARLQPQQPCPAPRPLILEDPGGRAAEIRGAVDIGGIPGGQHSETSWVSNGCQSLQGLSPGSELRKFLKFRIRSPAAGVRMSRGGRGNLCGNPPMPQPGLAEGGCPVAEGGKRRVLSGAGYDMVDEAV